VPLLFSSRLSLERLRHLSIFCRAALILSGCVAHQPRKLSDYQRAEAVKRREAGETLAAVAKSYGVAISMISRL
jgi:hypothetical protein